MAVAGLARLSTFDPPRARSLPQNGKFGRFVRRHPLLIAGAGLAAAIVIGLIVYGIYWLTKPAINVTQSLSGLNIAITITHIPPKGPGDSVTHRPICGKTTGADLVSAQVIVYAHTNRWYVEPYTDSPKTGINPDGTWCTFTHLGYSYAALLVRPTFTPAATAEVLPTVGGDVLALTMVDGAAEE
jgi:hypothetical protein